MKTFSDTIIFGADHNGFALKEDLIKFLIQKGFRVVDKGPSVFDKNDDYPDVAFRVAKDVAKRNGRGILICGSSIGVCVAANKVRGIRAGSIVGVKEMRVVREHDDVNVVCLSAWNLSRRKAIKIVEMFLKTSFSNEERHVRRIKKIERFEKKR